MEAIGVNMLEKQGEMAIKHNKDVSLSYLFFTFFKIGLVSFGGHMALISVIQRVMVDRDRTIENDKIMECIGVASIMPGPLAVNVVGQAGYHLRKTSGALISTFAIILPAFLFMIGLTWMYFNNSQSVISGNAMTYVGCSVGAIILAAGWQMFNKEIGGNFTKRIVFAVSLVIMLFTGNYIATVLLLIGGALVGALLDIQTNNNTAGMAAASGYGPADKDLFGNQIFNKFILVLLFLNQMLFFGNATKAMDTGLLKLMMVFAGISLSLFGGGYVMIPIMESLFVNELHWVNNKEFVDAIAFSQATPGPILISASFIGYKVAGIVGAILATISIFAPSVFLVIVVSKYLNRFRENRLMVNSLTGVKVVVVALILVSAQKILITGALNWIAAFIFGVSFLLSFRYKISPVYIILGSVSIGLVLNQF
ncbi:chromate efflux transporter [Flavihumibacter stibioxidans]|uniref:Chromate transporter n=1 Tax=Flavihumibacter stibioxidans TaxID=1834163 RepID=A0ABR7M6X7_9BACT|nr:chromate efflux transporter [Flavihumibacter stibioxidans]MBC6490284.1 hypothetical protein [Flavihumibacter stibioxidans]